MRPIGSAIELENGRKDAVRWIRKGERVTDVARDLGVSRTAVHTSGAFRVGRARSQLGEVPCAGVNRSSRAADVDGFQRRATGDRF
jgi:hypothetical protein